MVIHQRGSFRGGMERYYYHGSGMFGEIGRKLFSSGMKKAISSVTSSAIAHKVADAVELVQHRKKLPTLLSKKPCLLQEKHLRIL